MSSVSKSKKKKRVPNDKLLPEALYKFMVDSSVPRYQFADTHCHFEWLIEGDDDQGRSKFNRLKDSVFSKNEEVRKKIFEHLNFTSVFKEFCIEDGDFRNFCAFGCHPHKSELYNEEVEKNLLAVLKDERCVAFGEMGLDFFRGFAQRETQIKVFRRQLELSKTIGKPIIIHSRDAEKETVEILKETVDKDTKIHLHCYTSYKNEFAKDMVRNFPNCYIGFTGVLTKPSYCNRQEIKDLMDWIPLDRVLLESDGPFMMIRNKKYLKRGYFTSTCCNIPFIGEKLAEMKNMDFNTVMNQVFENSKRMYGIK